jgi:hypothetical protein
MTLLLAENEALSTRQRALQKAIDHNTLNIEALQQERREREGGRPWQPGLYTADGGAEGTASSDGKGGPTCRSDGSVGSVGDAESGPAVAGAAAAEEARREQLGGFVRRYGAYVLGARAERLAADGALLPLAEGDPRLREYQQLLDDIMALPDEDQYLLLTANLETGQQGSHDAGLLGRVARQMRLR